MQDNIGEGELISLPNPEALARNVNRKRQKTRPKESKERQNLKFGLHPGGGTVSALVRQRQKRKNFSQ